MPAPFMYTTTLASSDLIFTGKGLFFGYLIKMDGLNDQQVTFYDNTTNSGTVIKPGATLDAGSDSENGILLTNPVACMNGLYCEISGDGTREVTIYWNTKVKHF
jgi:hypothetical protein